MSPRSIALLLSAGMMLAQTPEEWFQRATAAHERGDLPTAIRSYQEVVKLRPEMLPARANLGAALAQAGQFREAVAAFRFVVERSPKNAAARLNLAQALLKAGDTQAARTELEILHTAGPDDRNVIRLLAQIYISVGDYAALLKVVEPAARRDPGDADLAYLEGMALVRIGRPAEGMSSLERAAKQSKSADVLVLAGATALNLGQTARACEYLDRAVALDSTLPGALSWAGLAHDRNGDEQGAAVLFRKALNLNPDDFEASLHLGAVLYRQKEFEAARPHLERAVRIQPSSSMSRFALALVRSGTGEIEPAIQDLEKVVAENPEWVEPRVKLASLYFRMKREAEGKREQSAIDRLLTEKRARHASFER